MSGEVIRPRVAKKSGGFKSIRAKRTMEVNPSKTGGGVVFVNIFPKDESFKSYREYWRTAELDDRISIERHGVPYYVLVKLGQGLGTSGTDLQRLFKIPSATFKKKIASKERFGGTVGQAVVETIDLINKVESLLDPSSPEARDFDPAKWVGEWIKKPQPSLGGRTPAELMDTPTGREQVHRVLGAIASGAYQ
jgi:uncharacterized protein (DUF2384 family)